MKRRWRRLDRFANVVREYYPGALVTVEGFMASPGIARLWPAPRGPGDLGVENRRVALVIDAAIATDQRTAVR